MTCNQLMILLAIYRGSLKHENQCGTYAKDLNTLMELCLITLEHDTGEYYVTARGSERVKALLTLI